MFSSQVLLGFTAQLWPYRRDLIGVRVGSLVLRTCPLPAWSQEPATPLGMQDFDFHFGFFSLAWFIACACLLLSYLCLSMPKFLLDAILHAFVWWMLIMHTNAMPPHLHMPCFMVFYVMDVFYFHHHDTTLAHAMHIPFAWCMLLACHDFMSLSPLSAFAMHRKIRGIACSSLA